MEEAHKFGARLRELRIQAGLTQRQLADRVGVDFTYLSKIENGVLPPPSERVILKLAEILHADEDELVTLAGKIPADIAQMLKNQKTLQLLRSKRTQKKVMPKATKPRLTLPKISIPFNNYKAFARVAVAIVLVIAIGTSLWFASPLPVKALEISFPSQSTSGTLGSTYTFTVKIDIQDMDVLPVWRVDLEIYNASDSSKKATLENLALATKAKATHTIKEGSTSGSAQLKAAAATDWGYGIAYSYGYGYREVEGQGWHYFDTRGGYGYSESPYKGTTSITYTVYWTSPSGWPEGNYKIKTLVYGSSDKQFSGTSSSFSLSTAAPVIGGGAAPQPVVGDVSDVIDEDGVFTKLTTLESTDQQVNLFIPKGTIGQTEKGKALDEITITKVTTSPEPPEGTNTIGLNYDLGPDGATFDPPIVLTFTYNAAWIPQGASEENLTIAYYDEDSGQWVMLDAADITVNPDTNTISAKISHFTKFSVMALVEPATLTASGLTITPSKANIAERITISATITNDGDLSGSQDISLKINGEVVSTKKVTLAGHATEKVTFVTVQGKPGSYTVDVNGQSGTFTIKPVPTEPVVITSPPAPPVPAPAPPAPSPAPAPPTPAPTPAPTPVNWWLIGIIAAVTVIVVGFVVWFFAFRREY